MSYNSESEEKESITIAKQQGTFKQIYSMLNYQENGMFNDKETLDTGKIISEDQGKWLKQTYAGYFVYSVLYFAMWIAFLFPFVNLGVFGILMYGKYEGRYSLKHFSRAYRDCVMFLLFPYSFFAAFAILYYIFDWPALNLNPFLAFPDPILFAFSCIAFVALLMVIIRACTSKETQRVNEKIKDAYQKLASKFLTWGYKGISDKIDEIINDFENNKISVSSLQKQLTRYMCNPLDEHGDIIQDQACENYISIECKNFEREFKSKEGTTRYAKELYKTIERCIKCHDFGNTLDRFFKSKGQTTLDNPVDRKSSRYFSYSIIGIYQPYPKIGGLLCELVIGAATIFTKQQLKCLSLSHSSGMDGFKKNLEFAQMLCRLESLEPRTKKKKDIKKEDISLLDTVIDKKDTYGITYYYAAHLRCLAFMSRNREGDPILFKKAIQQITDEELLQLLAYTITKKYGPEYRKLLRERVSYLLKLYGAASDPKDFISFCLDLWDMLELNEFCLRGVGNETKQSLKKESYLLMRKHKCQDKIAAALPHLLGDSDASDDYNRKKEVMDKSNYACRESTNDNINWKNWGSDDDNSDGGDDNLSSDNDKGTTTPACMM